MVKARATRDTSSDESCNEMRKQRGKGRQNKIIKLWSCPRAMKESIELKSKEEEEQPILTGKVYNIMRNNHTTGNS
ncbi:hypothetical protein YC2023_002185 [Brassica napus]